MRYLLDTNIIVFVILGDDDNVSSEVLSIIDDFSNILYISSLTIIELIFLFKNNKIKTKFKTSGGMIDALENLLYFEILHTKPEHLKVYSTLIPVENHKDQIDHFIISQAIAEKMILVSSDRKFKEYVSQNLSFVFNKR